MKIKTISIQNFRGISIPISLDLTKGGNPTSAILYGRNGTGKSSITDAWEWALSQQIQSLSKEGISAKDFPHKASNGKDSCVNIEFIDSTHKSTMVKFNPKRISDPDITGNFPDLKEAAIYPNFLRYSELQKFVLFTKTEKYKYIAKFFGLDPFLKCQTELQTTLTRLTSFRDALRESYKHASSEIAQATGSKSLDEANVLVFLNGICTKRALPTIADFQDISKSKQRFDEILKSNPEAAQIAAGKALHGQLSRFVPSIDFGQTISTLDTAFSDLKAAQKTLTSLVLSELYAVAIKVLPAFEDQNRCPICDKPFEGDLIKHLSAKHKEYSVFNESLGRFNVSKTNLLSFLDSLERTFTQILDSRNHHTEKSFGANYDSVQNILFGIGALRTKLQTPPQDLVTLGLSSDLTVSSISKFLTQHRSWTDLLRDHVVALENSPTNKSLAADYTNFVRVTRAYLMLREASEKGTYYSKRIGSLTSILKALTDFIGSQINRTFVSIENDVVTFFNVLEGTNSFLANPKINLVSGKANAIELEIEFASDKVTPAYKFMSESQINSFGLAIFLASVKHFNQKLRFFILDDVVNSFDAYKRPKLSQLLAKHFSDFQVLILTHDQVFFDTIQRDFPQWQRLKFASWDYTTGPRFRLAKSYAEEIQEFLDEDKPLIAGQTLGRYLEWTLGLLNESLQTPLRYKMENVYTLSEFYEPFVSRISDKLKKAGKAHGIVTKLKEFEQGTIFRNYCAHWKNETTPFTTGEIQEVFNRWQEIEKALYCTSCKTFASYNTAAGATYVRCTCGNLDLLSPSFYSDPR